MRLRAACSRDIDDLLDMLLEAFNWDGTPRMTRDQMMADPYTARYLGGWLRPGDFGFLATDDGGEAVLGAIWARPLTAGSPGYGYIADDVPELGMAVAQGHRGCGLGGQLLGGLLEEARSRGWPAVSLSVEDGNDVARSLYERHGFTPIARNGRSDTMVRML